MITWPTAPVFEPRPDFLGAPVDPRFAIVEVREIERERSRSGKSERVTWSARLRLGRDAVAARGDSELEALRALAEATRDRSAPWTEGSARAEVLVHASRGAFAGRGMQLGAAILDALERIEGRA